MFRARPFHGGHVGVLQCTVLKHFHRRYGEIQAANRPSFAYYNADNTACPTYANDGRIATCVAP